MFYINGLSGLNLSQYLFLFFFLLCVSVCACICIRGNDSIFFTVVYSRLDNPRFLSFPSGLTPDA